MKNGFRQSMAWLHTWVGLLVGWVLYFIFLTGTLGYFDTEIDRWMRPERPLATAQIPTDVSVASALRRLEEAAPGAERWYISPPGGRDDPDLRIFYQQRADAQGNSGASKTELLDSVSGEPVNYRETGGGQLLYRMHYELHYLPSIVAYWIVGACTMIMLLAIVTGVIIHKRIFKDFFTFRPGKRQRSWLDAHNVLSVVALPFHLMITYSGLIFFAAIYMPLVISASYGSGSKGQQAFFDEFLTREADVVPAGVDAPLTPLAPLLAEAARRWGDGAVRFIDISYPGDGNARVIVGRTRDTPLRNSERLVFDGVTGRLLDEQQPVTTTTRAVRDVLLGLHEGLFAGTALRWLYFLSGLLGTAMIGAGLVLWTVRRRTSLPREHFGLSLVERMNVATIVGLPIGIAAYFWANRLIPVGLEGRAEWEVHVMFIAWALMFVHAHCRSPARAWREQLALGAGLYLLLPLLNVLTTQRHLGVTVPHGDWVLAGLDLCLLAAGIVMALVAFNLRAKDRIERAAALAPSRAPESTALPAENG